MFAAIERNGHWLVTLNGQLTSTVIIRDGNGYGFVETPRERWATLDGVLAALTRWNRLTP